jgi:Ca2+-binding EF-hand superfamily protein
LTYRDHSGKLSSKEMKLVFEALGIKANSREMRRLMHKMDSDGDGEISFEEFLKLVNFYFKNNFLNYS